MQAIDNIRRNVEHLKLTLPKKVGALAVNFSKQRFAEQGWSDGFFVPWQRRRPGSKRNKGRALLVDSGRLRRSIRIVRATANSVTIGSDVPYAAVHNDGFRGSVTVKAHTRAVNQKSTVYDITTMNIKSRTHRKSTVNNKVGELAIEQYTRRVNMPRRRFIGKSRELTNQMVRLVKAELIKCFK